MGWQRKARRKSLKFEDLMKDKKKGDDIKDQLLGNGLYRLTSFRADNALNYLIKTNMLDLVLFLLLACHSHSLSRSETVFFFHQTIVTKLTSLVR